MGEHALKSRDDLEESVVALGLDPSLSMDIAPEVRRAYAYQSAAGVTLICEAIKRNTYKEFWFEHHDDILGVKHNGKFDVFQVKTRESTKKWTLRDKEVVKAITRFGRIESSQGAKIDNYFIYSNALPYLPSESTKNSTRQQISLLSLKEVIANSAHISLDSTCFEELDKLSVAIGQSISITTSIICKLEFIKGRGLEDFREGLASDLFSLPYLQNLSVFKLHNLSSMIFQSVEKASTLDLPGLDVLTSIISKAGVPSRLIENKCVTVSAVKAMLDAELGLDRKKYRLKSVGVVTAVIGCTALSGLYFYKPEAEALLEKSVRVVYSAKNAPLPPTFPESISAIRAAKLPLDSLDLEGATLRCQDLSKLNLTRMNGQWIRGTGAKFIESQLYMANFTQSELNASSYARATADSSIFDRSNMLYTDFSDSIVRWASFKSATLNGSDFSRSDLSQSDLSNADLTFTELKNANLSGSKFYDTKLEKANISGANFKGALGLTQNMLNSTCSNPNTPPSLDIGLKPPTADCFIDDRSKEERLVTQQVYALIGQMAALGGYCNDGEVVPRAPNGHGHAEKEMPFFIQLKPKE